MLFGYQFRRNIHLVTRQHKHIEQRKLDGLIPQSYDYFNLGIQTFVTEEPRSELSLSDVLKIDMLALQIQLYCRRTRRGTCLYQNLIINRSKHGHRSSGTFTRTPGTSAADILQADN